MVLSFDDRTVILIINEPTADKKQVTSHERHERAAVLCSHSDVFRAMLQPPSKTEGQSFKEAASLRVEINNFSVKAVDTFILCLQHLYLTEGLAGLTITHELLDLVLPLAVYYQSNAIIAACLQHVKKSPPDVRSICLFEKHAGRPDGGWAGPMLKTIAQEQLGLPIYKPTSSGSLKWAWGAYQITNLRTLLSGMSLETVLDLLDQYRRP